MSNVVLVSDGGSNGNIEVDTDEILTIVGKINDSAMELDDYIGKIDGFLGNISDAWQGKDANVFVEGLKGDYISELRKLKEAMDNYKDFLNNVPGKYDTLDSDGSSLFSGIEV